MDPYQVLRILEGQNVWNIFMWTLIKNLFYNFFLQMKKHNNLKHHKLDHVRYMKVQRIEKNLDFKRRIYLCSLVLRHTMSILAVDFL